MDVVRGGLCSKEEVLLDVLLGVSWNVAVLQEIVKTPQRKINFCFGNVFLVGEGRDGADTVGKDDSASQRQDCCKHALLIE